MNPLEALISFASPVWALKRHQARVRCDLIKRAFAAGDQDRTSGWRKKAQESINQKARRDLATTRTQARELYRNNPWAQGSINSIVANLVGCGIKPQARVMMPRLEEADTRFNSRADEEWKMWAHADDFYEKQQLVEREKLVAGEVLVRFATATDGRSIPLALEVIRSERLALDSSFRRQPPNTVQGIEFDRNGQRSAYWIYPEVPSDTALAQSEPVRVPADQILHIFDTREPGQIRGMTRLMTCAGTFEAIAQYLDFLLTKERVSSAFALMITQEAAGIPEVRVAKTGDSQDLTDEAGNPLSYLEGGIIMHGRPGEGLQGVASTIQSAAVDQFMTVLLRQVARGLDVAYELVSRDLSKVTYLSARQGENQDRRHWKPDQDRLTHQFNCPVWREFIRLGVAAGKWRVPTGKLDRYCSADWIPDGWDWVDPSKDVMGDIEAIKAGLVSPQEVCAKRGRDWFQILTDLEDHKEEATAKKLTLSIHQDMVAKAEAAAKPKPEVKEIPNGKAPSEAA